MMSSSQSKPSQTASPLFKSQNLQQAFTNIHGHCSNLFNPKTVSSLHTHIQSTFSNLQSGFANFQLSFNQSRAPLWARIAVKNGLGAGASSGGGDGGGGLAMTMEDIEERLAGIPVYALSNSSEEFVFIRGSDPLKAVGLFCFREEDAETLLEQMKSMDPSMGSASKVVPVALNKVLQLKVDGVAMRLIPESLQIKNALKERRRAGFSAEVFSGVPVFQSRSLILRSQNKEYRPFFFRKEDLEKSLTRAARQQKRFNPAFREGDIQVGVLEDIVQGMKGTSMDEWNNAVFVPPGFDVSTDPFQQQ